MCSSDLSDDGEHWSEPWVQGTGEGPVTVLTAASPLRARMVRIEQTGADKGLYWSIHDLQVFAN